MKPGTKFRLLALILIVGTPLIGGCSTLAHDVLSQHQCEREATNRPDAVQRKAECQLDAGRRPPPSQTADS